MNINYDKEKIKDLFLDFYNATGINIQLYGKDLCTYGYKMSHNKYCSAVKSTKRYACRESDLALIEQCKKTKEPSMHICHAGLVDIAVPVIFNEAILGYIMLGQMRHSSDTLPVADYLEKLGLDCRVMQEHYLSLPLYDNGRIQSVMSLATVIAKYILLEHMLVPDFNGTLQRAFDFIDGNLHIPISAEDIAVGARVSKSTLYKNFKEVLGCTVGEYLMKRRIEKAEALLKETDMSVQDISQAVGFSSAAYFTLNFKRLNGVPPLRYRKNNR